MKVASFAELLATGYAGNGIVIVGGGTLGLYLANLLVNGGKQVIVVEAGNEVLADFPASSFASVGLTHQGIKLGRSRSVGGTSNLWGGQLVEFQPIDFAGRSWLPRSKWPVNYEEVARHYPATYEALGIPRHFQQDDAVWRGISRPKPDFGPDLEVFFTRWMKIPSTAVLYAGRITSDRNLILLTDSTVNGFEGANGAITAVTLVDKTGSQHRLTGSHFVLAAGTIEISRLLLSAAMGESQCPWKDNRHVGAWIQDHLGGRIARVRAASPDHFFDVFSTVILQMFKFAPKIRMTNQALAATETLNLQAIPDFESSVSENLIYLKQFVKAAIFSRQIHNPGDFIRNATACSRYLLPLMWKYIHEHRILVPSSSKISLLVQSEQVAREDSRITVDPAQRDAHGLPRVILDWKIGGEQELASMREFVLRVDQALSVTGLAKLEIEPDLLALNPAFLDTLRDTTHQAGGAIMGHSADDGVVDSNLRVFGTENLYVAGAAVFRTASNANTTFTALTFATRLADHLMALQEP